MPSGERIPRALAVVTYFPIPQNHGDALRRLMVLDALASSTELTIVAVRRPDTSPEDEATLRARYPRARIHVLSVSALAGDGLIRQARRVLAGWATARPSWVYGQWSGELRSVVKLIGRNFDLAVLIGEAAGDVADLISSPRIIWDKSNVLSWSEAEALRRVRSLRSRLRIGASLFITRRYERRILRQVTEAWVTSVPETERLRSLFPWYGGRVSVLPSAVRISASAPISPTVSSTDIAWMSTLSYMPNWDGLVRLLEACDKTFVERGLTVRVVGRGAVPSQVSRLAKFASVDYVGYAADLAEALAGCKLAIVPVWSGAGVKLKTLTLIELGLPVVATQVGLEGIPIAAAVSVVNTASDFADAVSAALEMDLTVHAQAARKIVIEEFSFERFVARCRGLILEDRID